MNDMFDSALIMAAKDTLDLLRQHNTMLATAESCTGGLISACLTAVAGSSEVFDRGFVTYSNAAKVEMLGIDPSLIDQHGAVSEQVARAMAEGAVEHSAARIAVSVTGIAGPGGGSRQKPVGLVHLACAHAHAPATHVKMNYGDCGRDEIRRKTTLTALGLVRLQLESGTIQA